MELAFTVLSLCVYVIIFLAIGTSLPSRNDGASFTIDRNKFFRKGNLNSRLCFYHSYQYLSKSHSRDGIDNILQLSPRLLIKMNLDLGHVRVGVA